MPGAASETERARYERRRAFFLLILGLLQISGATMGVVLLIDTGPSAATVSVVVATGCVSLLSRWLRSKHNRVTKTPSPRTTEERYGNTDRN